MLFFYVVPHKMMDIVTHHYI